MYVHPSLTDESWLNVSEEELDQLLEERAGHNIKQSQVKYCQ